MFSDALQTATREIMEEKGLSTVAQINEHNCFDWAFKVFNLVPGSLIGGHRIDGEGQSYIIYKDRCYEAETPEGARYWWELRAFKRMFKGD